MTNEANPKIVVFEWLMQLQFDNDIILELYSFIIERIHKAAYGKACDTLPRWKTNRHTPNMISPTEKVSPNISIKNLGNITYQAALN